MSDCDRFPHIRNLRIGLFRGNFVSITTAACYVEFACSSSKEAEELYDKLSSGVYVLSAYERT